MNAKEIQWAKGKMAEIRPKILMVQNMKAVLQKLEIAVNEKNFKKNWESEANTISQNIKKMIPLLNVYKETIAQFERVVQSLRLNEELQQKPFSGVLNIFETMIRR